MGLSKNNNNKGVTLVELIIGIAILAIISSMVYGFFAQSLNVFSLADKKYSSNQDTSIAAYTVTEVIKNVKDVSLTNKPGYTQLNIQALYPNITLTHYQVEEENGYYSLSFTLTYQDGYSVNSKVLLNNIKSTDIGTGTEVWYLSSAAALDLPAIAIGSSVGTIIDGVGGNVSYPIDTLNIDNGKQLVVAFVGAHTGLTITSSPTVSSNKTTIVVSGTTAVSNGIYPFTVNYTGASGQMESVLVGANPPKIVVETDTTLVKGVAFDPKTNAKILSSTGTDITASTILNVTGSVNTGIPNEYTLKYNCTVGGVPAIEVVRIVTVVDPSAIPLGVTNLNVVDIEKNTPYIYSPVGTGGSGGYTFTYSNYGSCVVSGNTIKWTPPNGANKTISFKVTITDSNGSSSTFTVSLKTK